MDCVELIKFAEERHVHYCILGTELLQKFGKCFNHPNFSLCAKNIRTAGFASYREGKCDYNLAYLLSSGEKFESTIAHEVAHFVAHQLDNYSTAHGDLFKFVFKEFMGLRNRHHNHSKNLSHVELAKTILKIRDLKLQMLKDAAEHE